MIQDPHGQPFQIQFNAARRTERDLSEMLGLAKGMLSDGVVNEKEAEYLHAWGKSHPDAVQIWPASVIFERLERHYADGRIDDAERQDLAELLTALVGGKITTVLHQEGATELPLDAPPPLICWHDEVYVFTGKFAYGTRLDCQREVTGRGGSCEDNITRRTSFVVIGTFGSRDWLHTPYGRKIQRAVELRGSGFALRIVGEDHWARALSVTPRLREQ